MPSEALQNLKLLLAANPIGAGTPLAEQRQGIELLGASVPLPDGVEVEPIDAGGIPAEWLTPANTIDGRTILYLHGGGYNIGSLDSHRGTTAHIATACRARALLVGYRLAPEHPFPAAIDDCLAAYEWLVRSARVDPATFVVVGESAGGGLVLATLLAVRDRAELPLPAGVVAISPWSDLAGTGEAMTTNATTDPMLTAEALALWATNYAGSELTNPLASPHYGDPTGFPPLLLLAAEDELLRDDATRFAEKARASGVDVTCIVEPDTVHAWTLLAGMVPEAADGIDRIRAFVDDRL